MEYLLMIFLFVSLLASCSATSSMENATQEAYPVRNRDIVGSTKVPTV